MKTFIAFFLCCGTTLAVQAQSITGRWQLQKQTTCLTDNLNMDSTGVGDVLADMQSLERPTARIVTFRDNNTGEENTRTLSSQKIYNAKSFLYKFSGDYLYILDKKSRTIVEGYTVEKLDADTLIISNASRACETRVFVRLK